MKNELKKHIGFAHEGKKPFKREFGKDYSSQKGDMKKHIASIHEGKKPFKWRHKGNKHVDQNSYSNQAYKSHRENINSGRQTPNNDGKPKNTFRPPPPIKQNLPAYNAWFPTLPTPLHAPPNPIPHGL